MDILNVIKVPHYGNLDSTKRTGKYQTGGSLNKTDTSEKALTLKQMKQISNNWANGPQGYIVGDKYYNEIGEPVSKEHYDYYYDSKGKWRYPISSDIYGESYNIISNSVVNGSPKSQANYDSMWESLNTDEDGVKRTIRTIMRNHQGVPGQSYTISYDVDNPNLFFNAQGISREEAENIIKNTQFSPKHKKGSKIHIKKKNRGKFTEYCGGTVTQACIDKAKKSKNPTLRKRATFAENARTWKHQFGGVISKYQQGTTEGGIRGLMKKVYHFMLPEYTGTFDEAFRQARATGKKKFIYKDQAYTTDLKPNEQIEALKKWNTNGDLGKEEFKNQALRNQPAFIEFYTKYYPTHFKNNNFDLLYSTQLNYDRNAVAGTKHNLGAIVYKNLADGWNEDMISAAMGNSYVETGGWRQLTQTGGPAQGLFMMEAPERARYRKWLKDNNLKESQANEVNYIQHLFDSKSELLGTPWSNLDKPAAIDRINKTLKKQKKPLIKTGDEARAFVKTLKTESDANLYGVRSAWKHQNYTSAQAWDDWDNGDLDAKTKAFEALFERAGIPDMDRRYYLSHLIKKNQHIFSNK